MESNELMVSKNEVTMQEGFQPETFVMEEDERMIADLTSERRVQYCSMTPKNTDEEIALFNAMNSSDKRLADCINTVITIRHIFVEVVTCHNQDNPAITQLCPRIVLIDADGVSYQCVSIGIFSAMKKLLSVKGDPRLWDGPVYVQVLQITKDKKKMLSIKMVSGPKVMKDKK